MATSRCRRLICGMLAVSLMLCAADATVSAQSGRVSRSIERQIEIPPRREVLPPVVDEPQAPVKLSVALAIDSSFSLRMMIGDVITSAQLIMRESRAAGGGGREACVYSFTKTEDIALLRDWTTSELALSEALDEIYVRAGETALLDAAYAIVEETAVRIKNTKGKRGVVVLITDGEDKSSRHTVAELRELLNRVRQQGNDVRIFPIALTWNLGKRARERARTLLTQIADSGGEAFFVESRLELSNISTRLAARLRESASDTTAP